MPNEENVLIKPAMGIITHAGDARLCARKSLEAVKNFDFDEAYHKLEEAKKEITKAHQAQTEVIQSEARGEKYEYCMLFNHAQDTLMTVNSEIELVSSLVDVFKAYYDLKR